MRNPNPFEASSSALGYLYQCRYGLMLLLERVRSHPESEVSIERFDDIAFVEDGNPVELIQTKHHVTKCGDLSDASSDLWKTIRVWADGLKQGRLQGANILLLLVTTSIAPDGSAASKLRPRGYADEKDPKQERDEQAALQALINVAANSQSKENSAAYQAFNSLTTKQRNDLIRAMFVVDKEPKIVDLLPRIHTAVAYAVRPEHIDYLIQQLEGWWFAALVRHLSDTSNSDRTLRGFDLQAKLFNIQDSLKPNRLPNDLCFVKPDIEPNPATDGRVFVRQLRVIGCSNKQLNTAICDQYKSFRQRSEWVRRDLIMIDELEQYDDRLVDEWQREFESATIEMDPKVAADEERKVGREIYKWSQQQFLNIRSDFNTSVVMRGSFHALAEDQRVGWHPRYFEVLATNTSDPSEELTDDAME